MTLYKISNIKVPIGELEKPLIDVIHTKFPFEITANHQLKLLKKSLDARKKTDIFHLITLEINLSVDEIKKIEDKQPKWQIALLKSSVYAEVNLITDTTAAPKKSIKPLIIGMGPAGIFAALTFVKNGIAPIIFEQGKRVEDRYKDIQKLFKQGELNENSNIQNGEGGAGTFSDGKLYSRVKSNLRETVLETLVHFGASPNILFESHPHIGTDKLRNILINIRKYLESHGTQIFYDTQIQKIIPGSDKVELIDQNQKSYVGDLLVLSPGHSSRQLYKNLAGVVQIESKPFAVGFRIELPQSLINQAQWGFAKGPKYFENAAAFSFTTQVDDYGIYSFCMCPGGIALPASSHIGHQVVNGMSNSTRSSGYANSGYVIEVQPGRDYGTGIYDGMDFQTQIETKAFNLNKNQYVAPAQRVTSFLEGKVDATLPKSSYPRQLDPVDLNNLFNLELTSRFKQSLRNFDRVMKGVFSNESILLAAETRTSSPIRIPRNEQYQSSHPLIYPAGEGPGYAGGIMSAAIDGINVANSIVEPSGSR